MAAPATAATSTIAVLPFMDLSEQRDQGVLSDGLAEELLSLLSKIPELRVTARASSFAFRDRRTDITAIGRQLNVANVLDGSVRKSGNRLRFTVQLVQTSTGTVVWSETYNSEIKDVFKLQDDVAGKVVDALKIRLLADQHIQASERTQNVQAYEQFLLGLKYGEGAALDDLRHAMAAFERSSELDPSFARAHAAVATMAVYIGGRTVDRAMYDIARERAQRAIALSPRLASAYVARGMVRMYNDWDFAGARADLDYALGVDPNSPTVQGLLYNYQMVTGRFAEALAAQQSAVERNPLSAAAWRWLAKAHMGVRDYANARKAFERADEIMPGSKDGNDDRALMELYAGNYQEALRRARLVGEPGYRDYVVAMTAWSAGKRDEAQQAAQRLIDKQPNVFAAQIAQIYAWWGDRDRTYYWIDHALDLHDPGLFGAHSMPEFDKFRSEPRFQQALRRMNLPQ